jgi:predicted transcriptional regulator
MAASLEKTAQDSLSGLVVASEILLHAKRADREARLRFLRDAREAGWNWKRIANALGVTEAAVRKYWKANRMAAGRIGARENE